MSGVTHEIDVLASQGNKVLAAECKNYDEARFVGIKEIRDFQSKLNDLPHINSALFVTNSRFSSEMKIYANQYKIELWDGDRLSKIYLSILIGRHESVQTSVFESALPVTMSYDEVSTLKFANRSIAKITKATLFFSPYYVFDYRLDLEKIDRSGKNHRIKAEGIHVVDGVDEDIIKKTEQGLSRGHIHAFFSKKEKRPSDYEQALDDTEEDQIVRDLATIKPESQYKIEETADYSIPRLDCKVPFKVAKGMVLEKVIEENTREISYKVKLTKGKTEERKMTIIPKYDDIRIKRSALIYVPKWVISIGCKSATYLRKILAASKTILIDEIQLCPKDFSLLKIWSKQKPTYALCELCGSALCLDHIFKLNELYYCEEHNDTSGRS